MLYDLFPYRNDNDDTRYLIACSECGNFGNFSFNDPIHTSYPEVVIVGKKINSSNGELQRSGGEDKGAFFSWLERMDRKLQGNSYGTRRKVYDNEGSGYMWTSNEHPGGHEMRYGGRDIQAFNIDVFPFLRGGYSIIGWGSLKTAWGINAHRLGNLDYMEKGMVDRPVEIRKRYKQGLDTILVTERPDGTLYFDTIPIYRINEYEYYNKAGGVYHKKK